MVTKGLYFQFCDIENCAQKFPKKKASSKISQLYTRKNHIFSENFPTFGSKFDKICPQKTIDVHVCLCMWFFAPLLGSGSGHFVFQNTPHFLVSFSP
jgi:hypothetical protein